MLSEPSVLLGSTKIEGRAPCFRWVGVDQVFLRENSNILPPKLKAKLQPLIDSGFLVLDWLPGRKHPLQNRWYNRCSKPDMAGAHSWVAFVDLDEFLVVLDKCATLRFHQLYCFHDDTPTLG